MKTLAIIIFAAEVLIALFLLPGCFTKMYQKDVVKKGRYHYCEEPFNCNFNEGHYIGTEDFFLGGGADCTMSLCLRTSSRRTATGT